MLDSTALAALLATPPFSLLPLTLLLGLASPLRRVAELIPQFLQGDLTPQCFHDFEQDLAQRLRQVGREIVQWACNESEPEQREQLPPQILVDGVYYQRGDRKTPNRNVATLFGVITLWRYPYRPIEEKVVGIFPLELGLGLEAGRATPALADRVALHAAQCTQQTTLETLDRDHGVKMSTHLLRNVTASASQGMSEHRHPAQVAKLLRLLKTADASRGNRLPILAVGRDGIMLPIRRESCYREGAVGTVTVLDRAGKRLGTVYLGCMPEPLQLLLSQQLTALIQDVLKQWDGPMPRLVYITDAGHHPTEYYQQVLRRMADPRCPAQLLRWEKVLDYYHACLYITKLAETLFYDQRRRQTWAAKMRRLLRDKPHGIHRVLHTAAALRKLGGLWGTAGEYDKAYKYLRAHIGEMDYHGYRKLHLPIGSGITEAACKTVCTQRMKQSGMTWNIAGGRPIVALRVIHLSGIWREVRAAYLQGKDCPELRTQLEKHELRCKKVA